MHWIKRGLFLYLAIIGILVSASVIALITAPPVVREPSTYYQAYWNVPETLDPTRCYETRGGEFLEMALEGLYEYDGFDNPTKILPALAAEMPTISDDRLTYTIRLRPNVRYPDVEPWIGKPRHVRADDFVFSFKRMADYHQSSRHFDGIMRNRIVGANEFFEYSKTVEGPAIDYDHPLEGIVAVDEQTLQITLTQPFPQLIYNLMKAAIAPMPREWYMYMTDNNHDPDRIQWSPLGTGPYQLVDRRQEQYHIFEWNPLYRGRPDVDGHPNGQGGPHPSLSIEETLPHEIRRVVFRFNREVIPRWYKFTLGEYDRSRVPRDAFGSAIGINGDLNDDYINQGIIQSLNPRATLRYIGFAMDIPWIRDNVYLRRAMSLAINRERYVEVFANGDAKPSNGIIPHCMNEYSPDHVAPFERYDIEEAKSLVEQAKQFHRDNNNGEELPTLTFTVGNTSATHRQSAEDMRIAWEAIGLDIQNEHVEWGKFLENLRKRNYECWRLGWVADYPDEETFFSIFYGPNRSPGPNGTCFDNAEYNALYKQAIVMQPGAERKELYNQLAAILESELPVVNYYYDVIRDLGYDYQGRVNEENEFQPIIQDHIWLKAKPAYYRFDADLREARIRGRVTGPMDQVLQNGEWTIRLNQHTNGEQQ